MARALKLAVPVLALGVAVLWWWGARETDVGARSLEPEPAVPALSAAPLAVAPLAREPLAPAPPAAAESRPPPTISGRVLDAAGRPVAAARLGWKPARSGDVESVSDADGAFTLVLGAHADEPRVACLDPERVTLVPGQALGRWTVVVAPRLDFAGLVVDETGAPIAGAEVSFLPRAALFRALGLHPLGLDTAGWHTRSDEAGRFALAGIAGGAHLGLEASAPGHDGTATELPATSRRDLVLVLTRRPGSLELRGVVLEPSGAPCAEARVAAGEASVRTDVLGRFTLAFDGAGGRIVRQADGRASLQDVERAELVALAEGRLPARESLLARELSAPFVLRLGAEPLTLAGRIRDETGAPRAGLVLWLQDSTHFERAWERLPDGSGLARDASVEGLLCGGTEPVARSDADGRFELGCLMDGEYALLAFDPRGAACAGPWLVAAGSRALELEFPREPARRVAGRVVSARGTPRAGLTLRPQPALEACDPPTLARAELAVTTAADGRFEFPELARSVAELELRGGYARRRVSLAELADLEHIELVEPELCELEVELSGDPGAVQRLEVLDARGARLELRALAGNERVVTVSGEPEATLLDGRSGLLLVAETARTLVVYESGRELLRLPLALEPGRRTVVRP